MPAISKKVKRNILYISETQLLTAQRHRSYLHHHPGQSHVPEVSPSSQTWHQGPETAAPRKQTGGEGGKPTIRIHTLALLLDKGEFISFGLDSELEQALCFCTFYCTKIQVILILHVDFH